MTTELSFTDEELRLYLESIGHYTGQLDLGHIAWLMERFFEGEPEHKPVLQGYKVALHPQGVTSVYSAGTVKTLDGRDLPVAVKFKLTGDESHLELDPKLLQHELATFPLVWHYRKHYEGEPEGYVPRVPVFSTGVRRERNRNVYLAQVTENLLPTKQHMLIDTNDMTDKISNRLKNREKYGQICGHFSPAIMEFEYNGRIFIPSDCRFYVKIGASEEDFVLGDADKTFADVKLYESGIKYFEEYGVDLTGIEPRENPEYRVR